jgi:hypothetical protein
MVGKVLKGVVLLCLAFVGLRMGAPYVKSYEFARVIKDEVETKSVKPSPTELHARVLELGRNMDLNLKPEDVSVTSRDSGGFEVIVHYDVTVDLILFQHQQSFDFTTRTRAGGV